MRARVRIPLPPPVGTFEDTYALGPFQMAFYMKTR